MNLENFDATEISDQTEADLEAEQTLKIRQYRSAKKLILSPEVAQALREGWTYQEIADALGVSYQTVLKWAKSQEMQVLIEAESRRVLDHLSGRKLGEEKYRDLVVSLGVLIDKTRLLRNEPTEIYRTETSSIARLEVLLFGQRRTESGGEIIETTAEPGTERLPELHGESEGQGSSESQGRSDGSDKH